MSLGLVPDVLPASCLRGPGAWPHEPWQGDMVTEVAGEVFASPGDAGARPPRKHRPGGAS